MLNIEVLYRPDAPLHVRVRTVWPYYQIQSGIWIDPAKRPSLTKEQQQMAETGTGRVDHMLSFLLKYAEPSWKDINFLKMNILAWVNTLDLETLIGRRYFAEAYLVVYLEGTIQIKIEQTDYGPVLSGQGQVMEGTLRSWEVEENGTGICTLEGTKEGKGIKEDIKFQVTDLLQDDTLVVLVKEPDWFHWKYPKWQERDVQEA
ncbi:hypothetical protein LTR72_011269 [Exophiala xenobiotica]|nr:hypothetical protein LTR92_010801 [Exophiala xenobiotica]KAK5215684.1 hypothetical protein LTR72_011269 [Exophiala xenobiotica]KAK5284992.1 hypothetical protein LTR14_011323 [Exophiala xenobiotica]